MELKVKDAFERHGLDFLKSYVTPAETDDILKQFASHLSPETKSHVRTMILEGFREGNLMDHREYSHTLQEIVMSMSKSDWKYTIYKRLTGGSSEEEESIHKGLLSYQSGKTAVAHSRAVERSGGEEGWQEEELGKLLQYNTPFKERFKYAEVTPGSRMKRCKGSKQKRGNQPLKCHIVDLEEVTFSNIPTLSRL